MSTWISEPGRRGRAGALLLGALLGLAACEPGGALSFGATSSEPIKQARLAGGQVVLTAPRGYCLDPDSLRRGLGSGFALMARCDRLGSDDWYGAHDLAVITVTTTPFRGEVAPGPDALAAAAAPARVLDRQTRDGVALVRVEGDPNVAEADAVQWRGVFVLNGQLVGLSLYAPTGSSVLNGQGAGLLLDVATETRAASTNRNDTDAAAPADT